MRKKLIVLVGLFVAAIPLMQLLKYNSLPPYSVISGLTHRQDNISEKFDRRVNRYFDLPLTEEELIQKLKTQNFKAWADQNFAEHSYQGSWGGDVFNFRIAWSEEDGEVTEITGEAGSLP